MQNKKIIVKTKSKSYPIYFGDGIVDRTNIFIKKNLPKVKKIVIISDKNLPPILLKKLCHSLKKFDLKIYKISSSEKMKNFTVAYNLTENLLKDNLSRSDCVISLGGGIVSDISAFVSSLTKRGVRFVNIPTTLLAQVDASVGGKTGVNSRQGKNLIGTFYQPDFVLIDVLILNSLTNREMVCGYGKILKHALIADKKYFFWLSKNSEKIIKQKNKKILKAAILKSCLIKSKIVSGDEREKNLRMILNFGHTFAHGFEGAKSFSKKLNHGEAVLLGMITAAKLSLNKKLLSLKDFNLIKKHYLHINLPLKINSFFKKNEINNIIAFMKKDKKNLNENLNLILLKKIGQTTKPNSYNIKSSEVKKFLQSYYI